VVWRYPLEQSNQFLWTPFTTFGANSKKWVVYKKKRKWL